jgi:diguanylate cyclase (GGDEF)-like protein
MVVLDIFEHEQNIHDDAVKRALEADKTVSVKDYISLVKQYGKLLKQLRRTTRFADRTSIGLHESNLDLTDKVHYDVLTEIYNRRYMEESLKRLIKSSARSGKALSILLLDVDYFKKYNDFYGHGKGDDCLKVIAKVLAGTVMRADDFAARYGGEEFIVVLPDTDEAGAELVGKSLLEGIRNLCVPHEESHISSHVTISIGSTTVYPKRNDKFKDYIMFADEALYTSKKNGRNQYTHKEYIRESKEAV